MEKLAKSIAVRTNDVLQCCYRATSPGKPLTASKTTEQNVARESGLCAVFEIIVHGPDSVNMVDIPTGAESLRHAFSFPDHIRSAVQRHVANAIAGLKTRQFRQEPNYTAALAGRLVGTAYDDSDGKIVFNAAVIDDRGPNAAEHQTGADWSFTAEISDGTMTIRKGILVQSKLGAVKDLSDRERKRLNKQIEDMKRYTYAPKVMEVVDNDSGRCPRIVSGNRILEDDGWQSYSLGGYITGRVMTTLDGDTRTEFVDSILDSKLTNLNLLAETYRRYIKSVNGRARRSRS
ncbi:MAG: hypothetical protein ABL888_19250 [Pirellulaceae bacterium]